MIDKPGIYKIPEAEYHADPCPQPALSASMAKVILAETPLHGWYKHPRLNPDYESEHKAVFDFGSAAHAMLLEGKDDIVAIDADSYRTKDAKEARDKAYSDGKTPLLIEQYKQIIEMTESAVGQLNQFPGKESFFAAYPEMCMVWQEGEIWCRSLVDKLAGEEKIIWDYKTTAGSAAPEAVLRRLFDVGADLQAAFYLRGYRNLTGNDAKFRYIMQETKEPFALTICELSPYALDQANEKVDAAIEIWRKCVTSNEWPGYPQEIAFLDPPSWTDRAWIEKKLVMEDKS